MTDDVQRKERSIDDRLVLAARGAKNRVDPWQPYHFLVEQEVSRLRRLETVATLFLTNRECPLRCTMCDLWKNTLDEVVPAGAIPRQIDYALERLPPARHIKLYNSGNFFDPQAIPPADYAPILDRLDNFETIIVENHPRFCGDRCYRFQQACGGRLEVALGLETVHPQTLMRLNKKMTLDEFDRAVDTLLEHRISVRAFILLQPPFLSPSRAVEWCLKSLHHAFQIGVDCCSVIPTRAGNGLMEQLAAEGAFEPPRIGQLEEVAETALAWNAGRRVCRSLGCRAICRLSRLPSRPCQPAAADERAAIRAAASRVP